MPDHDALERLSKKLDARATEEEPKRSRLFPKGPPAPGDWHKSETPAPVITAPMAKKKRFDTFEIIFAASMVFFVAALAVAGFLFFSGTNTVSTKNVDIQISGPTQIGAGNTLTLQIVVTNRNAVPMQLSDLVVEFPSGTRSAGDVSTALPRIRESLGDIAPGESVNRTVKAVLFGKAETDTSIKASVEYRVPSSNAIFVSETVYTTRISESPATITVNSPSEVVSGQGTEMTVTVTSNSAQVLKNMLLSAHYPPGFVFSDASPSPVQGTALWNLGDIESGGTRTVSIRGTFTGEDGDQRAVTFTTGSESATNAGSIAAPLASGEADMVVTKPFISTAIALRGSVADTHTIARGDTVQGTVQWTNNLPVAVHNLAVTVSLKGQILDQGSVRPLAGFFNSSNSSMIWDKTTNPSFADVAPGESGTLSFSFKTLPLSQGTFRNPAVDFTVTVKGDRTTEGNVPETVHSTATTKAIVATDLAFAASVAHASGPLPPKVNTESVYTVTWRLSSSANALANTAVTAVVPNYARFVGNASPGNENVSYDERQGIVTWSIGNLSAGENRNVSFQIGVTPSVSQSGGTAIILQTQRAAGFDRFVQDTVQATVQNLDTGNAASGQGGNVIP